MEFVDNLVVEYNRKRDDKILSEIMEKYSPLVGSTVAQYSASKIPPKILEGEAKILLAQAVNSYKPGAGYFSSHAKNYMKGMSRVVNNANPLYIPADRASKYNVFIEARDDLSEKLKRTPTHDELADSLNWSDNDIKKMVVETGKSLLVGNEIEDSLRDAFFDKTNLLEFVYQRLDSGHQKVLDMTFGLHGVRQVGSDREIAAQVGVSQTMIRNMKEKIISMLKEYR